MSKAQQQDVMETAMLHTSGQALYVAGVGWLLGWGTTPGNGVQGWAPGAHFIDTDASGDDRVLYNSGSATTATWTKING